MKKIKIAPSTKSGASHWLHQRISAIAMIPLTILIAFSGIYISQDPFNYISVFFAYPLNAVMAILFIAISLFHGSIGMRVIIEDYVSNKAKKYFYIIFIDLLSIATAIAGILAIIRLHLIG